jgi:hypothetical protein
VRGVGQRERVGSDTPTEAPKHLLVGFRTVSGSPSFKSAKATGRDVPGDARAARDWCDGPERKEGEEGRTAAMGEPGGRRMDGARLRVMYGLGAPVMATTTSTASAASSSSTSPPATLLLLLPPAPSPFSSSLSAPLSSAFFSSSYNHTRAQSKANQCAWLPPRLTWSPADGPCPPRPSSPCPSCPGFWPPARGGSRRQTHARPRARQRPPVNAHADAVCAAGLVTFTSD